MVAEAVVAAHHLLVEHDEEEVEARHDRLGEVEVVAEVLRLVVAAALRVGGSEDRGARVERRGDPRLGDRDRLLLHRLVDRHLGEGWWRR